MAASHHNIFHNEGYNYDLDQPWVCGTCLKTVSSSRPPVYNADNCSCADLGGYTNGLTQVPQPATSPAQGYQYEANGVKYYQPPQSYASSTASVPCPEGVEREDPNLRVTSTYLPLGPDTGLNEVQHRRSASFHSDMSFQMRRFLIDQEKHQPHRSVSPPAETNFLKQDIYILSQNPKKNKTMKRRNPSYQSFTSTSSEEYAFVVGGGDATAHVGKWIDEDRFSYSRDGYGYPSSMSGMTDESNGE